MNVTESFSDIYDKTQTTRVNEVWTVHEQNADASFKRLELHNPGGDFHVIENCSYKGLKGLTEEKSTFLRDTDCDGVGFTSIGTTDYMLLCELKSNIDSKKILGAYKQIIFTLLKLYMMFSLCKDFEFDRYSVMGIIGCKPPKNIVQEDELKYNLYLLQQSSVEHIKPDIRFLVKLYFEKKMKIKFKEIPFIKDKALTEKIMDSTITLYLKTGKEYNDDYAEINMIEEL